MKIKVETVTKTTEEKEIDFPCYRKRLGEYCFCMEQEKSVVAIPQINAINEHKRFIDSYFDANSKQSTKEEFMDVVNSIKENITNIIAGL